MELREKVARAIARTEYERQDGSVSDASVDALWEIYGAHADAAIAAMSPQAPPDDEARWIIEQAVRLVAIPSCHRTDGQPTTLAFAVDVVRAELLRLRQDMAGEASE